MIKEGQFTVIDGKTYQVMRIEEQTAHLQNVETYKGRPRKMLARLVPYFAEDGNLIVPEPVTETAIPTRKLSSKVNIRKIIAENTEMQVSKNAIMWLHEQLAGICEALVNQAELKAEFHNHKRIEPRHIQHVPIPESAPDYVYLSHDDYIKDGI
tara:strand:+ start:471 stop:932 length:462 start_codon:yes stop_codon:yes gene_type:complete